MTIRLLSTLRQLIGVSVLALQVNAWAAETPLEMIRATVNQILAVLQDPAYQGADQRQRRRDTVQKIALPRFDAEEIAKRALGIHWRERTEAEKKEFTQLFTQLVEKSYSDTLDRYTREVKFFFDQERIEDGFAEVDTRVFDPSQNKTFSLDYHLLRVDGQWLIYDVVIENVSLVRNYRNQFNRIITRSSYADLIQSIKSKLQQLDTTSAS